MNITLPGAPVSDIASTTTAAIVSFAAPAEIICGILLAFLVVELLIHALTPNHSTSTTGTESAP